MKIYVANESEFWRIAFEALNPGRRYASRIFPSALLLFLAGCRTVAPGQSLEDYGISYLMVEVHEPRPNRVHVLQIDLSAGRVKPEVVVARDPDGDGPAEAALIDPFSLAADSSILAFINTNPWDSLPDSLGRKQRVWYPSQPVDILGLAASGGELRSPARSNGASIWFDSEGLLSMGDPPDGAVIEEGLAGFQQILSSGEMSVDPAGPIHPRTAICGDAEGTQIRLVVVDGRQEGFSEGMTLGELSETMRGLGCWDAMNLDGGGSSMMALRIDGQLRLVNSPSDRWFGEVRIRPIPSLLTLKTR